MTIQPVKTEQSSKFTYLLKDITAAVKEDLTSKGYRVEWAEWNETNTKLDITAVKLEKGGK